MIVLADEVDVQQELGREVNGAKHVKAMVHADTAAANPRRLQKQLSLEMSLYRNHLGVRRAVALWKNIIRKVNLLSLQMESNQRRKLV